MTQARIGACTPTPERILKIAEGIAAEDFRKRTPRGEKNRKKGIRTKRKEGERHKMDSYIYGKVDGGQANKI
jgi:hypothetical protein